MPTTVLPETASQTAGPYQHIGMYPSAAGIPVRSQESPNVMAGPEAQGERIRIEGRVFDGLGSLAPDILVELWQADAGGKYNHPDDPQDKTPDPHLSGFGRAVADFETGLWWFETVKPGPVPFGDGRMMAPHINVSVYARGINIHLITKLYFDDETDANATDPVMNMVRPPDRRETLVAKRSEEGGQAIYRFDIRLQGDGETVFFDI